MQITTSFRPQASNVQAHSPTQRQSGAAPEELATPSESFVSGFDSEKLSASRGFSLKNSDLVPTLVIGGVGLASAAVGAFAGANAGILSGLVGSVVGASAGATLGLVTPGERIGLGAVGGAITGTLIGAMGGNTATAVALGLAGATLPFGLIAAFAAGR